MEEEQRMEQPSEQPIGTPRLDALERILNIVAVQELLKKFGDWLESHAQAQKATVGKTTKWTLIWAIAIVLLIAIAVTVLTSYGKLSSDAAAFLYGTIVGAVFAFIRAFLIKKE